MNVILGQQRMKIMSNEIVDRKQKETGLSKAELNKLWELAQTLTAKKNLQGTAFFKMLNSVFNGLVKDAVKKESIECDVEDVICEFLDTVTEETVSGDIAQPVSQLMGKPCFHTSDLNEFLKIGMTNRKKSGWYNKFYGSKVGNFAKQNKHQDFYIKNENPELVMYIKRKRK